jgi:hypothetical protein
MEPPPSLTYVVEGNRTPSTDSSKRGRYPTTIKRKLAAQASRGGFELRRSEIFVEPMNHKSCSEPQRGGIVLRMRVGAPAEFALVSGWVESYKHDAPTKLGAGVRKT